MLAARRLKPLGQILLRPSRFLGGQTTTPAPRTDPEPASMILLALEALVGYVYGPGAADPTLGGTLLGFASWRAAKRRSRPAAALRCRRAGEPGVITPAGSTATSGREPSCHPGLSDHPMCRRGRPSLAPTLLGIPDGHRGTVQSLGGAPPPSLRHLHRMQEGHGFDEIETRWRTERSNRERSGRVGRKASRR